MIKLNDQTGFTLTELVMAMAIFSFMLIIVSTGYLQVLHMSEANTALRAANNNGRLISDTLEREIQANTSVTVIPPLAGPTTKQFGTICLESTNDVVEEYTVVNYILYQLTLKDLADCTDTPSNAQIHNAVAVNDSSTSVVRFLPVLNTSSTTPAVPVGATVGLSITGSYVLPSDLNYDNLENIYCTPMSGSQYCSVTNLDTAATLRGDQ